MDSQILYLGLDPTRHIKDVFHLPMIKIKPRPFFVPDYKRVTHVVFTSRSAITIFCDHYSLVGKKLIAIGAGSAQRIEEMGFCVDHIAKTATAEGVIELLESLKPRCILLPHAARARLLLPSYLKQLGHFAIPIYDTELLRYDNPPSLDRFKEIIFTSASTVEAFFNNYRTFPPTIKLTPIGPITAHALRCFDIKNKSC